MSPKNQFPFICYDELVVTYVFRITSKIAQGVL